MDLLHVELPEPPRFDETIGAWVVTRYAEVEAALLDKRLNAGAEGVWHKEYREAAVKAFSGSKLADWRATIDDEAQRICLSLQARPVIDVVDDFARPWSAVVAEVVTGESLPEALACARSIFDAAADPFDKTLQQQGNDATRQLAGRFGGTLAPLKIQAFVALSNSLPVFLANSCYALLSRDQRPDSPAALEELLRYAAPSKAQLRRAVGLLRIGEAMIAKDDRVALMLASANRDPRVFHDPETLDLARSPNKHLAFGVGLHSCVGGALVRMASSIALRVLFDSFPTLTLEAAEPRQRFALRAIESLRASSSRILHPDRH